MDLSWLERTELLIGKESVERLSSRTILIVGLGGVGSFAAEFVARAGIGNLTIIDGDVVDKTNKNRQLPALTSTVGMKKAELMAARIRDINPDVNLRVIDSFQRPEHTQELVRVERFDYVMDYREWPTFDFQHGCWRENGCLFGGGHRHWKDLQLSVCEKCPQKIT